MCSIGTHKRKPHRAAAAVVQDVFHQNTSQSALPGRYDFSQAEIDHVLRVGGNTDRQRECIVAAFEEQKSTIEIAAYLQTLYHGGMVLTLKTENLSLGMTMTASICRAAKPCGLTVPHQSYHGKTQLSALDSFCRTDTLRPM